MQITITLDGNENRLQLRRLAAATAALAETKVFDADLVAKVEEAPVVVAKVFTDPEPEVKTEPVAHATAEDLRDEVAELVADQSQDIPPVVDPEDAFVNHEAPEVDAEGLPHDSRIHSSSKSLTVKGTWRRRKNIDDAEYDAVVAELRSVPAAPVEVPPAPPAPAEVPPAPPAPVEVPPAPPAPPAPKGAVQLPAGLIENPNPFELMRNTGTLIQAKLLEPADIIKACEAVGIANLGVLMSQRPDLAGAVNAELLRMVGA